ncbi:MAG: lipid A phosphoethanolamine transferase [Muribaculaceae bacterium]|nr:lipid A phosphoethanolamine transferase [Muribaculaceae bacterium]
MPLLLIAPNVAITTLSPPFGHLACVTNIVLPLGIYMLLMAWSRNSGRTAVLMTPLAALAAFQIVVMFLYQESSALAVDMFLNVVTTNSAEVGELLGNLALPMLLVITLYLPPLLMGIVLWCRHRRVSAQQHRRLLRAGYATAGAGVLLVILSYICVPNYRVDYDVFPVNALCNLTEAFHRSARTKHYAESSADFTFNAKPDPSRHGREIYVAIVGETSRADHYQLFGYPRFTNPRLCTVDSLIACEHVLSESNTTHKSVPMLLSTVCAENYNDSIYTHKSVISGFREAGFHTVVLSAQSPNGSFIDFFCREADSTVYLRNNLMSPEERIYDDALIPKLDSLLATDNHERLLVVLHLYGCHFNYNDRYSRADAFFLPDKTPNVNAENREQLINAYDNAMRVTDEVLYDVISRLDSVGCPGGMIYTADHGEDIFDDERGRFLHASPTPTFAQLYVPMLLYFNGEWRGRYPEKYDAAKAVSHTDISSSESYSHTLLDMAGIETPRLKKTAALTSGEYRPVERRKFLNDRNEAVNLHRAGFKKFDFESLENHNINR